MKKNKSIDVVEEIQVNDEVQTTEQMEACENQQAEDCQPLVDVKVAQKSDAGAKIKQFFRSLFVSENGNEAKFLTLYKKEGTKSILSSLICIVAGILIGWIVLVIIALADRDIPNANALTGLKVLLSGPFSRKTSPLRIKEFGNMLFETTPLILTGLSVAIAFKTGLFNIGAPGQYLMGVLGALIVGLGIPTTEGTAFFVWLFAIIVGMVFGMIWGLIPGLFKALLGVNEVIVCIMTNWIAANIVSWVFKSLVDNPAFINQKAPALTVKTQMNGVATPKWGLDKLFPRSDIDISIFIAIAIAIGIFILLNKTTLGYELKACGHNKHASKYAGMNEKRNIMLSMAIAGGLAAIGAALFYLNGNKEFPWDTYAKLPDEGFNGIPVALLASNNPVGVIFGALFLKYIDKGGYFLTSLKFNEYMADFIVALIIYFSGFSKFIKDLLTKKRKAKATVTVGATADVVEDAIAEETVAEPVDSEGVTVVEEVAEAEATDTEAQPEEVGDKNENKFAKFFVDLSAKIKALFAKKADENEPQPEESADEQIEEKEEENK